MTTMPTVPLDDQLLAVASIGVPVGLGIYLAWVNRDATAETNIAAGPLTAAGALVGAWLRFDASDGILTLITTIIGASVGANLALLTLDIARAYRSRHSRLAGVTLQPVAGLREFT